MINFSVTPYGKMKCITNCSEILINSIRGQSSLADANADNFLPQLIYVLIKSNPPYLRTNLAYLNTFSNSIVNSLESQYYKASFEIALGFIDNLDSAGIEDILKIPVKEWRQAVPKKTNRVPTMNLTKPTQAQSQQRSSPQSLAKRQSRPVTIALTSASSSSSSSRGSGSATAAAGAAGGDMSSLSTSPPAAPSIASESPAQTGVSSANEKYFTMLKRSGFLLEQKKSVSSSPRYSVVSSVGATPKHFSLGEAPSYPPPVAPSQERQVQAQQQQQQQQKQQQQKQQQNAMTSTITSSSSSSSSSSFSASPVTPSGMQESTWEPGTLPLIKQYNKREIFLRKSSSVLGRRASSSSTKSSRKSVVIVDTTTTTTTTKKSKDKKEKTGSSSKSKKKKDEVITVVNNEISFNNNNSINSINSSSKNINSGFSDRTIYKRYGNEEEDEEDEEEIVAASMASECVGNGGSAGSAGSTQYEDYDDSDYDDDDLDDDELDILDIEQGSPMILSVPTSYSSSSSSVAVNTNLLPSSSSAAKKKKGIK